MTYPQVPGKLTTKQDSRSHPRLDHRSPLLQHLRGWIGTEARPPAQPKVRAAGQERSSPCSTPGRRAAGGCVQGPCLGCSDSERLGGGHSTGRQEPSGPVGWNLLSLSSSPGPGTWVRVSQTRTGAQKGLCLVFKSPIRLFQNYPPRGTQKPNTSSIPPHWSLMRSP